MLILNDEYMNGSQFSDPRYMNGVGFEMTGHTHPYQNTPPPFTSYLDKRKSRTETLLSKKKKNTDAKELSNNKIWPDLFD